MQGAWGYVNIALDNKLRQQGWCDGHMWVAKFWGYLWHETGTGPAFKFH